MSSDHEKMARATLLLAAIALAAASVQATYDCSKQLDLGDARFDLSSVRYSERRKPHAQTADTRMQLKGEHHFETSYDTPPTVTKVRLKPVKIQAEQIKGFASRH